MNVVVVDTGFANYHSVLKAVERAGEREGEADREKQERATHGGSLPAHGARRLAS